MAKFGDFGYFRRRKKETGHGIEKHSSPQRQLTGQSGIEPCLAGYASALLATVLWKKGISPMIEASGRISLCQTDHRGLLEVRDDPIAKHES